LLPAAVAGMALLASIAFAPEEKKPEKQTIRVDSVQAFIEALGPDRVIVIEAGTTIRLDEAPRGRGEFFRWVEHRFVKEKYDFVILDCPNLEVRAAEGERPLVCTKHDYANVLRFENCRGLTLRGLRVGHDPEPAQCFGAAAAFENCESVTISDCILYGSGTEGLTLSKVKKLTVEHTVIEKCTSGLLSASDCEDLTFRKSTFRDTPGFFGFDFRDSAGIRFLDCVVENVRTDALGDALFKTNLNVEEARIVFDRGAIRKSRAVALCRPADMLKTVDTELADNTWTGAE
jgi:hypothetical protein